MSANIVTVRACKLSIRRAAQRQANYTCLIEIASRLPVGLFRSWEESSTQPARADNLILASVDRGIQRLCKCKLILA